MRIYTGHGMDKMLDTAHKYGLNRENSVLTVKNKGDFDSPWKIRTKE